MRLNEEPARIEADDLRIGARGHALPDVRMRKRVERFVDGRELIAPDLRIAPEWNVVGRGGRRQQQALLLGLKVLEWLTLRATVPPKPVVVEAPVSSPRARVVERGERFTGKALITDAGHRALHAPFVARMPHRRGSM